MTKGRARTTIADELTSLIVDGAWTIRPRLDCEIQTASGKRSLVAEWQDFRFRSGELSLTKGRRTRRYEMGSEVATQLHAAGLIDVPGTGQAEAMAAFRVEIADRIDEAILGRQVGRMPANVVRSIEEDLHSPVLGAHVAEMRTLREASVVRYSLGAHLPSPCRRTKAFEEQRLFVLDDVYASPLSGVVWLPNGDVLQESVGSLHRILGWGRIGYELLLERGALATKRPIVLCPCPRGSYFHWLFEMLPSVIHALAHRPNALVVVHRRAPQFVMQALAAMLGPRWKSRVHVANAPLRLRELVMSQQPAYGGFIHPDDLDLLAHTFQRWRGRGRADRLLYVSRRGTDRRVMRNEARLEEELAKLGFEIFVGHRFSFLDQVRTFARARVVIGPHGAGLSNLVWTHRAGSVLELTPARNASAEFGDLPDDFSLYPRLFAARKVHYEQIECDPAGDSQNDIPIDKVVRWARRAAATRS